MRAESWLNPLLTPRPLHRDPKAADNFPNFLSMREEPKEVRLIKVANIKGNIELRADLCARSLGGGEKVTKFFPASSLETLRNVGHDRNRGSLHLPRKPEVFCKSPLFGDLIDCPGKHSSFLPCN
jgi:hypothetical protein